MTRIKAYVDGEVVAYRVEDDTVAHLGIGNQYDAKDLFLNVYEPDTTNQAALRLSADEARRLAEDLIRFAEEVSP